jgi:hypothetical protein
MCGQTETTLVLKMPYKEKLKKPSIKPRKKPQYKVVNWTELNTIRASKKGEN